MKPKRYSFFFLNLNIPLVTLWQLLLCLLVLSYLFCCWIYKIDNLPGLHGDEAWFGLEAYRLLKEPLKQPTGMNFYTGALQTLVANVFFSLDKVSVFNLRISGVIFNLTGLIIITRILWKSLSPVKALVFLLFVSQSALLVCSARVAWEVNTFTLFFTSITLLAINKLIKMQELSLGWVLITLTVSLLASYNHIIFSAVPVALMLAFGIQYIYQKHLIYLKLSLLFAIASVDILLQLLWFKYWRLWDSTVLNYYLLSATLFLGLQALLLVKIRLNSPPFLKLKLSPPILLGACVVGLFPFAYFHGIAFFETLAGYKVYMQHYSLESGKWIIILSAIISAFFIFFSVAKAHKLVLTSNKSLPVLFVVCYAAIFSFYTTLNSYRYYLELNIILALFITLTFDVENVTRWNKVFIYLLIASSALAFYVQYEILFTQRHERALSFKMGNNQYETSAHFLPKRSLIKFLKKNQIDSVILLDNEYYFINKPIEFYKHAAPWTIIPGKKAVVMYQSTQTANDGILYFLAE